MTEFKINLSNLGEEEYSFQEIMKMLHAIQQELLFLSGSLNFTNSQSAGIKRKISESADYVNTYRINIQNLQHGLIEVLERYEVEENKLTRAITEFKVRKDIPLEGGSKNQFFELDTEKDNTTNEFAFVQGSIAGIGAIAGIKTAWEASGELLGGSNKNIREIGIEYKKDETGKITLDSVGIEAGIEKERHVAKGFLSGTMGLLSGGMIGTLGSLSGTGTIGAALYKDGKLSPQLFAKIEGEAAAAKGEIKTSFGTEKNNAYIKGEGTLLGAEAELEAGIGKITFEDKNGKEKMGYGIQGSAGAEAYLASGTVSGGFTFFGIEIEAGVTGKAGGAGANAEYHVTTGGVGGSVGLGALVGIELDLSIDWSNFKFDW